MKKNIKRRKRSCKQLSKEVELLRPFLAPSTIENFTKSKNKSINEALFSNKTEETDPHYMNQDDSLLFLDVYLSAETIEKV